MPVCVCGGGGVKLRWHSKHGYPFQGNPHLQAYGQHIKVHLIVWDLHSRRNRLLTIKPERERLWAIHWEPSSTHERRDTFEYTNFLQTHSQWRHGVSEGQAPPLHHPVMYLQGVVEQHISLMRPTLHSGFVLHDRSSNAVVHACLRHAHTQQLNPDIGDGSIKPAPTEFAFWFRGLSIICAWWVLTKKLSRVQVLQPGGYQGRQSDGHVPTRQNHIHAPAQDGEGEAHGHSPACA